MPRAAFPLAVALVLLVLAASAPGGTTTFSDPAGDNWFPAHPDITDTTLTESRTGMLTFDVAVSGSLADYDTDVMLLLDLDKATDRSEAGGKPMGAEYMLYWRPDEATGDWDFKRWADTGGWWPTMSDTAEVTAHDGHYVFRFHRSDLGSVDGFSFLVWVMGSDIAPNDGKWVVSLGPDVVVPQLGVPGPVPARPVVGRRFTLTVPVTRAETELPLSDGGALTVTPSVAGKVVPHSERLADGEAVVTLKVPKTARGRILKVDLKVRFGTESAHKVYGYRVR